VQAAAGDPTAIRRCKPAFATPSRVLGKGPAPAGGQRGAPGRWIRVVPPHPPGSPAPARPGEGAEDGREPSARPMTDRPPLGGEPATPTAPAGIGLHVVPVLANGRRSGTIAFVRPDGTARLSAEDDRLLSAVAAQLGLAIERDRLQQEATEAEILRRTDELKSALINAVSHDLRTPLASIITAAGSLRQNDINWTDEERQEFAQAIEEEAQRLNRIVSNLLDLSRIEGGSLRPEKGWYDLGALIDDVLGRLRGMTADHPVRVHVPEDLPPVHLDYVEIDQVLSNLIENATKYTPAGAEITIAVEGRADEIRVEVGDRGPGIPAEALPRLFEAFYRVDGLGPRPRGTGVGLAVVRGLVEAHGGRIWAENRSGGGARFVFTLPLTAEAPAPIEGARA
jgi:two-component system sensor histidine kinase KdpD